MNDDAELLRRYAEEGAEEAFAELVRRHLNLVYSSALRRTSGDGHRAEDVAQQVFMRLARDARQLSRHAVLGAWLHRATRNAAINLMLSEQRRKLREEEVQTMHDLTADSTPLTDPPTTIRYLPEQIVRAISTSTDAALSISSSTW